MAQRTKASIEIDVKGLKAVNDLLSKLNSIDSKVNKINRASGGKGGKDDFAEIQKVRNQISRVETKSLRIRNQLVGLNEKDRKVSAIKGRLTRAENKAKKGQLDIANRELAIADKLLAKQKLRTAETVKQTKASAKMTAIREGNFAGSGPGVFGPQPKPSFAQSIGIKRGFDTQSALISGAFPLLFGQGPVGALAGGLGGGIGGMFGGMGGFAGGIAATAVVQQIQGLLDGVSKLGQALSPLVQDVGAVTTALGLQGSAQEAQLKRIERTQGKTAAFNASMTLMGNRIDQEGINKIKNFGETTRLLGQEFSIALLKLQAFAGGFANFISNLLLGQKKLKEAEIDRVVKDAAALGNEDAQKLLDRGTEIEETGFKMTRRGKKAKPGTQDDIDQLKADKASFAVANKINLANDEVVAKSQTLVEEKTKELDLQKRIKEEMAKGTNKELATSLATVHQVFDAEQKVLQNKVNQSDLDLKKAENQKLEEEELQKLNDIHTANTNELDKHNELRDKAIKLEKDLNLATSDIKTNFEIIGESIASGVTDNITAAIQGTKSLGDAAKSILNDLSSSLIKLGVNTILSKIPGFGGLPILGFADGGRPPVGKPSIVGEKGPELFVPKRSGTIIPNDKLAGGGSTNISVNIDASGSSVQGNEQQGKELGRVISAAIQSELIKQRRPGGLLR